MSETAAPTAVLGRTALMLDIQQLLVNAPTNAGAKVYVARDWPDTPVDYPNIRLAMPRERKESLGRVQPQFYTTATVAILVRTWAKTSGAAEAAMEALCGQIEAAIFTNREALGIQQFKSADTDTKTTSDASSSLSETTILIACEFYEKFSPAAGDPLTQISMGLTVDADEAEAGDVLELTAANTLTGTAADNLDLGDGNALDLTDGESVNTIQAVVTFGTATPTAP